jgi:hypothetical protein
MCTRSQKTGEFLILLFLFSSLVFFNACAEFQSPSGRVLIRDKDTSIDIRFTDADKYVIQDYYRRNLPPGLAKRSTLPPGLQKQLQRKGSLPPGLSAEPLPYDLEHKLSRLPEGYIRVRIETDIFIMRAATKEIFDVLHLD